MMIKSPVASRLLGNEMRVRGHVLARIKRLVEEVDMALYDRSSGIGFVYGNMGLLLRKVQAVGATAKPSLFSAAIEKKDATIRTDSLNELKDKVSRLQEMHARLEFMMDELEGLVKKS